MPRQPGDVATVTHRTLACAGVAMAGWRGMRMAPRSACAVNASRALLSDPGVRMKKLALICVLSATSGLALAAKPCEELKTEIAAKIDANKVTNYTLEIVESDKAGDAKVVGSCEGGTKKIVYTRK